MFLNLLRNIFASWKARLVPATMFPEANREALFFWVERRHEILFLLLRLPVGRGGVTNSPRSDFLFCFRCDKLGYRSWVIPLCILLSEPVSPQLLSWISSKLCHQNTQFNMYTVTSKQQECSTCKDSYPKCFITTDFNKFHREGAINRGGNLKACFRHFLLCFHFNFYTSIKLVLFCAHVLLKYLNKTHFLTCK